MLLSLPAQAQAAASTHKPHKRGGTTLLAPRAGSGRLEQRASKRARSCRTVAPPSLGGATILLVCADEHRRAELSSLCALAGAQAQAAQSLCHVRDQWNEATAVIVDAAVLAHTQSSHLDALARRERVVIVHTTNDAPDHLLTGGFTPNSTATNQASTLWQHALHLGAQAVWTLPQQQTQLIQQLRRWVNTALARAVTIGVIGGNGGVGASTLAAALAVTGNKRHLQTVLIDADPLGGGIDLLLDGGQAHGSRWPQLAHVEGSLNAQTLREELPVMEDLFVLSWDRSQIRGISCDAMTAVLAAATRGSDLVVVDLPRYRSPFVDAALVGLDRCLVYVDGQPRSVAAAGRVLASIDGLAGQIQVVARGVSKKAGKNAANPQQTFAELPLPISAVIAHDAHLGSVANAALPPGYTGKGNVARFCNELLDEIFTHPCAVA